MLKKIIKTNINKTVFFLTIVVLSSCAITDNNLNSNYQSTIYSFEDEAQGLFTVTGDHYYPAFLNEADLQAKLDEHEFGPILIENTTLNVWDRIRDNFQFEDIEHSRVDRQFKWFKNHPDYLNRVATRATPYMHFIVESLEAQGIPGELALLPIVESAFKPFAYSHGRASGIWQFIPSTGRLYGLKQNWWYDGRRDIYASTNASLRLLKNLASNFNGDWMLALAAYNSGQGTVQRAINRNKKRGRPTDFFSLKLPKETKAYVPKLLALKKLIMNPELYNLSLLPIRDEPYFKKIDISSQIDLALAAEMAGITIEELYNLNPGFNRWATAPKGPHYLLIPADKSDDFEFTLADLPINERIKWKRHKIRKGETVASIARKYHISPSIIKRTNNLRSNRIREGHNLLIPTATKKLSSYKLSSNQRVKHNQNIKRKGRKIKYTIQRGDTWWGLAMRHGVGTRQLAKWNSLSPRDKLQPGQKIIIWARTSNTASNYRPITRPPNRTQRIGYRVRKGDSLSRISKKFRVSIKQIKRWNHRLSRSKYLYPGQRITLYIDVTRQSS
ncbi:MAG: LysM peptidoglycan-binding domain-containing protein [Thiohalomonadales bacterium]